MHRLAHTIATVGGIGFSPSAPGTVASIVAVLAHFLLFPTEPSVLIHIAFFVILTSLFLVGVWASGLAEKTYGHDPSCVVIDEVVGMGMALFFVPKVWYWLFIAFVLFRVMDVRKDFGIDRLQRLPGGWGIMVDDVAAGFFTMWIVQGLMAVTTVVDGL